MTLRKALLSWMPLVLVLTGACSSTPFETVESDGIRIWTTANTGAEMNCFVLAPVNEDGEVGLVNGSPLFWPSGSTVSRVQGVPVVDVPGFGSVSPGDEILGGGGYGDVPDDISVPQGCVGQTGEVAFLERLQS